MGEAAGLLVPSAEIQTVIEWGPGAGLALLDVVDGTH